MTQKQLMDALLEKIATQAAALALMTHQRNLWYQKWKETEERAVKAEQERDCLAQSHAHLVEERDDAIYWRDAARQHLKEADTLIQDVWDNTSESGSFQPSDFAAYGRWRQTYRDLYLKPVEQKAEVGANGRAVSS